MSQKSTENNGAHFFPFVSLSVCYSLYLSFLGCTLVAMMQKQKLYIKCFNFDSHHNSNLYISEKRKTPYSCFIT